MSYIYGLYDPRVMSIRYVGKTHKTLSERLCSHICEGKRLNENRGTSTAVYQWIAKLLREGVRPEIKLLEECAEELEDYLEIEWIANMRLCGGPKLLNLNDGGTGGHWSDESRAKVAISTAATWEDPEIRERRMEGLTKPKGPASEIFKAMRSEVQARNWEDPDYRANQIAKRKERPPKTHCNYGHEMTPENTYIAPSTGYRSCRICQKEWRKRQRDKRRAERAANPKPVRTHCDRGHELTEENTYITPQGWRRCRICRREQNTQWYRDHPESNRKRKT